MPKAVEGRTREEYTVLMNGERTSAYPEMTCDSLREAEKYVADMKSAEKAYDLQPKNYRIFKREVWHGDWKLVKRS